MHDQPPDRLTVPPNPFPRAHEVTLGLMSSAEITVQTKAIRDALSFVDEHLRAGESHSLAIVGDYGAGKSHIASQAIRQLLDRDPRAIICIIRAEYTYTIHGIYTNIFRQHRFFGDEGIMQIGLGRTDLDRRIRDVRSQMIQNRYGESESHQSDISRVDLAAELASMSDEAVLADDIEFTRALQSHLSDITHDREFAYGLSLLLHSDSEISSQAWEWLRGGPVTPDLAKRGVEEPIGDDDRALKALEALALLFNDDTLFNERRARFSLFIDDFERLSGRTDDNPGNLDVVTSRLIRWAAESRSLLVMSVLENQWNKLSLGVRQRVGRIIWPTPLTRANIVSYHHETYRRNIAGNDVVKFANGSFSRIYDVTGGMPRNVVKIFYNAYRLAADGTCRVTPSLVEQAARAIFESLPANEVYKQIYIFCTRQGYTVGPDGQVGDLSAPLWVSTAQGNKICTIVVAESLLNSAVTKKITQLGTRLGGTTDKSSHPGLVLIIAGQLAESQESKVNSVFPHILRWGQDGFLDELRTLISNLAASVGTRAESILLQELRDEIGSLHSSRAEDHSLLRQLAEAQDETHIRRLIREEAHRAYLRSPANSEPLDFGNQEGLQQLFDDAVSAIRNSLARAEQLWQSMFLSENPARLIDRSKAPGGRPALPTDLTSDPIVRAIGVLMALDYSIDGFGRAIIEFQHQAEESPRNFNRKDLIHQCSKIDQAVEDLIVFIPSSEEDPNFVIPRVLGVDRLSLLPKVKRLGSRVHDTIYSNEFESRF
jgi:hypothetical protein